MAWTFELAAECGDEESAATRFANYFDGFKIDVPFSGGVAISTCRAAVWSDEEKNWWCSVIPSGVSLGLEEETIFKSPEQVMTVTESLYKRLKLAPLFRYAVIGFEVTPFDTFGELTEVKADNWKLFHGLVLSREVWEVLRCPKEFVSFAVDRYWTPFQRKDLIV